MGGLKNSSNAHLKQTYYPVTHQQKGAVEQGNTHDTGVNG